ncbi:hypothetical protein BCR39DRAFT_515858 [Naematelia encephala]|uniref:Uncharacterized protein n=1 Tax=Naematelia encephala TaxID=71784 RepID=A0A1Y2BJN3_9TREE|nr:hypothetical protein BCR39DRAFT_515858 [Naematelia encephala]
MERGYDNYVYRALAGMAREQSWVRRQYPQLTYRFFVPSSFDPKVQRSPAVTSNSSQLQSQWRQPPPGWWARASADEGNTLGSTARRTEGLLPKANRSTIPFSTVTSPHYSEHTQSELPSRASTHLETEPGDLNRQADSFSVLLVWGEKIVVNADGALREAETLTICPVEPNPDYPTPVEFYEFWKEVSTPCGPGSSLAQATRRWNEAQTSASQSNTGNLR